MADLYSLQKCTTLSKFAGLRTCTKVTITLTFPCSLTSPPSLSLSLCVCVCVSECVCLSRLRFNGILFAIMPLSHAGWSICWAAVVFHPHTITDWTLNEGNDFFDALRYHPDVIADSRVVHDQHLRIHRSHCEHIVWVHYTFHILRARWLNICECLFI